MILEGFFRSIANGGVVPDEVTLRFARPPGFDGLSDEEMGPRSAICGTLAIRVDPYVAIFRREYF